MPPGGGEGSLLTWPWASPVFACGEFNLFLFCFSFYKYLLFLPGFWLLVHSSVLIILCCCFCACATCDCAHQHCTVSRNDDIQHCSVSWIVIQRALKLAGDTVSTTYWAPGVAISETINNESCWSRGVFCLTLQVVLVFIWKKEVCSWCYRSQAAGWLCYR